MKIRFFVLAMLLVCMAWSEDKVDTPKDTLERWLSYFEKGAIEKYVEEALLLEKIIEMKSSKEKMAALCTKNKQFFVDTLKASLKPKTSTILSDGENSVAVFYWVEPLYGYEAMSLLKKGDKWIACKMYKTGDPVSSRDKP